MIDFNGIVNEMICRTFRKGLYDDKCLFLIVPDSPVPKKEGKLPEQMYTNDQTETHDIVLHVSRGNKNFFHA